MMVEIRHSQQNGDAAIVVEGIGKSFGTIQALAGVNLKVRTGTVLALLGPNGAGKTTLVRILTTLLAPDTGKAFVAGHDVVRDADALRSQIGLAGQYAAVDGNLTGRENLEMVGRLYHLPKREVLKRAEELLSRFLLSDAARRLVRTYSGGMRRRLDLAASLVARPQVLFLDEPTTGLDPRSRRELWQMIKELVSGGMTLLLTTQHMEEADQLAHQIVVIDRGRIIAQGTSRDLKSRVGGDVVELHLADRSQTSDAASATASLGASNPKVDVEAGHITLPVSDGTSALLEVVRRLDGAHIAIADIQLHRPTLDDVFLALTGHGAEEAPQTPAARGWRQ